MHCNGKLTKQELGVTAKGNFYSSDGWVLTAADDGDDYYYGVASCGKCCVIVDAHAIWHVQRVSVTSDIRTHRHVQG